MCKCVHFCHWSLKKLYSCVESVLQNLLICFKFVRFPSCQWLKLSNKKCLIYWKIKTLQKAIDLFLKKYSYRQVAQPNPFNYK